LDLHLGPTYLLVNLKKIWMKLDGKRKRNRPFVYRVLSKEK
jgi:hypothetical protein